jgi:peptidoglycan/LPS O-acetylase OafA/YrhL
VVFYLSNWNLNTNWVDLLKSIGNWALFTINTIPGINKYPDTSIIIARVVWSLPYEWFFYICLPLIGFVLLKNKPHWLTIAISLIVAVGFYSIHGISIKHVLSFAGGGIAPFLLKYQIFKFNIKHWAVSVVVVLSVFSIGFFNSAHHLVCKAIIAIIFTLIACGNNVFGLLKNQSLKLLGTISYSTYLLHGIVLFITFKIILVGNEFQNLSSNVFALVIVILTPIIVVISYLTYLFIEKPFIDLGKKCCLIISKK